MKLEGVEKVVVGDQVAGNLRLARDCAAALEQSQPEVAKAIRDLADATDAQQRKLDEISKQLAEFKRNHGDGLLK